MRRTMTLLLLEMLFLTTGIGFSFVFNQQIEYSDNQIIAFKGLNLTSSISPIDIVWEMLGQVDEVRVLTDLQKLTGEAPICIDNICYTITNRLTGSIGLHWAQKYVYNQLASLGYSVEYQGWSLSGYSDENIKALKPGLFYPNETVYIVAHMDGVKIGLKENFPSADDNASSVVDLLELARIFSNYSFGRTLILLLSTGE